MLPSPKWADAAYRISDLTRDELLPQFVVLEGPTLRGYVLDNNKQNEVDPEESPKLVSELIPQTKGPGRSPLTISIPPELLSTD